jgi:hypothetical protein
LGDSDLDLPGALVGTLERQPKFKRAMRLDAIVSAAKGLDLQKPDHARLRVRELVDVVEETTVCVEHIADGALGLNGSLR